MLTTLLDDSDLSKIRKSIFIFASITFFTYFYQLNISAPKALFSSATSAGNRVEINYLHILTMLAVFQFYLLVRLFISSKISFAIFNKNWKIDEFKEDEDLVGLRTELRNFNNVANEKLQLKQTLIEADKKLDQILVKQAEMSEAVNNACKVSEKTAADQHKLTNFLNKQSPEGKVTADQLIEIYHFNCNELPHLMGELNSTRTSIDKMKGGVSKTISELVEFQTQQSKFNQSFPASNYKAVTEINQQSLINSRKYKVVEMWVFEIIIPAITCLVSLIVCLMPESNWLSDAVKFII